MIKGLGGVSIWSEDLRKKLLPFYRDTIGLPVAIDSEGFVLLGDQNAPALGLGTHSEVHGASADPFRIMVGLRVDDCAAEVARLEAKGVVFIEKATPQPDGGLTLATLKDPEGNVVQLFQFS